MTHIALGVIMACIGDATMSNAIPCETVCRIVDNDVCDAKHARKKILFRQLIFYRWRAGGYQIVGYMLIRPDTAWQHVKRGDYHCIEFEARDGKWRMIRSKTMAKEDTRYDPEVIDRRRGERECLFDLQPWGDVRG